MKRLVYVALIVAGYLFQLSCTPKVIPITLKEQLNAIDTLLDWDTTFIIDETPIFELVDIDAPKLLMLFRKTPCIGKCESYIIEVYDNGRVIYEGEKYVDKVGFYEASVDSSFIKKIVLAAETINYFELSNRYPERGKIMMVFPPTITYMRSDSLANGIYNAHHSPVGLQKFERFIIREFEALDWKKIEPKK